MRLRTSICIALFIFGMYCISNAQQFDELVKNSKPAATNVQNAQFPNTDLQLYYLNNSFLISIKRNNLKTYIIVKVRQFSLVPDQEF